MTDQDTESLNDCILEVAISAIKSSAEMVEKMLADDELRKLMKEKVRELIGG